MVSPASPVKVRTGLPWFVIKSPSGPLSVLGARSKAPDVTTVSMVSSPFVESVIVMLFEISTAKAVIL